MINLKCDFCEEEKANVFYLHIRTGRIINYCNHCDFPSMKNDKFYKEIPKEKLFKYSGLV